MKTKTFSASSRTELLQGIRQARADGLQPTLGILFCSVSLDIPAVAAELGEFSFPFFAASSCGEILSDAQASAVLGNSAAVALLELPPETFRIRLFNGEGLDSQALGAAIGAWGAGVFPQPAFLLAVSGIKRDGEQVVRGLCAQFPTEVPLFGGLAGDDAAFKETSTFTNDSVSRDGAVVCVLDSQRVSLAGVTTGGWVGLGAPKTVTGAEGNVLLSLDGQPALDTYKQYLGIKDEDLPGLGVEYPLQVLREDGAHVLRAVLGVDSERRALVFAGTIPLGAKVRFSSSPGFETVEYARRDFEAYPRVPVAPHLVLYFSCMARHLALGPMVEDEFRAAQRVWNAPGVGFFTYGEIGPNQSGRCDFHNETCVVALLTLK
jgi:small ligand-binding sensory domain FIST